MPTTYNPRDTRYQNNDQRYSDWVAQGRPSTDSFGNELDVRGEVVGSDNWTHNYLSNPTNQQQWNNIYGQGAAQTTLANVAAQNQANPWDVALGARSGAPSPLVNPTAGKVPTGGTGSGPTLGNNVPSPVQLLGREVPVPPGTIQPNKENDIQNRVAAADAEWRRNNPNFNGGFATLNNRNNGYAPVGGSNVNNQPKGPGVDSGPPNTQTSRIGVDPTTGRLTLDGNLLDRYDARLWGSVGRNVLDDINNDTYYMNQLVSGDDSGDRYQRVLRPEIEARLRGRTQLSQSGIGGYSEVIDPRLLDYDPEFGFLTPGTNIGSPDSGRLSNFLNNGGLMGMLGLGALGAIGAVGGFSGLGIGGAGIGAGDIISGTGALAETTAPVVTEQMLQAGIGAGVGAGAGAGAGIGAGEVITGTGALAESIPPIVTEQLAQMAAAGTLTMETLQQLAQRYGPQVVRAGLNLINQGGNPSGGGSRPTGGGNGGGGSLPDLIAGGAGYAANRNNIRDYNNILTQLIERGDPYGPQRQAAIARLNALEANPENVMNNPFFRAANDRSLADLSRTMAARGYLNSGNELGALSSNSQANFANFYQQEWERNAREAGVYIDPGTSVQAGLRGAGEVLRATSNNEAALAAILSRAFGGGGSGSGGNSWIADLINGIFGNGSGDGEDQWETPTYDGGYDEDYINRFDDEMTNGGGY